MLAPQRKYQVTDSFTVPDLTDRLPATPGVRIFVSDPIIVRNTDYDTSDRRLAHAGITLRYQREEPGSRRWIVTLAPGLPSAQREVSVPGRSALVPNELVSLLTAYHRGDQLQSTGTFRITRRSHEIRDTSGRELLRLEDDQIRLLNGRRVARGYRELTLGCDPDHTHLVDPIDQILVTAGASPEDPKIPPLTEKSGPDRIFASEVVSAALRGDILRIMHHDPLVRLRQPLAGGDSPVHQMQVGCRKLRGDLWALRPLLHRQWATQLRAELSWLAGVLGSARESEVLRDRLRRTARDDPTAPLEPVSVARIEADLAARHEEALQALESAFDSARYLALLDGLIRADQDPRLSEAAQATARWVTTPLPLGDRARTARGAVAMVLGGAARELASTVTAVRVLLGEAQDELVSGDIWLAIAAADPDDHALAITAGRLFERDRVALRSSRAGLPRLWSALAHLRLAASFK